MPTPFTELTISNITAGSSAYLAYDVSSGFRLFQTVVDGSVEYLRDITSASPPSATRTLADNATVRGNIISIPGTTVAPASVTVGRRYKILTLGDTPATYATMGATTTTAGAFEIGRQYIIRALGDTDYTLIGASTNTVGIIFTATGPGVGTGTAYEQYFTPTVAGSGSGTLVSDFSEVGAQVGQPIKINTTWCTITSYISDRAISVDRIVTAGPIVYPSYYPNVVEDTIIGLISVFSINATTIELNKTYQILTVGTTNFMTSFGAVDNNIGTEFTANAAGTGGSGTGTVTYYTIERYFTAYNTIPTGSLAVSGTFPGESRIDSGSGDLYIWSGTTWVASGGSASEVIVSATAPGAPTVGMQWFRTTDSRMFLWNGTSWVQTIPGVSGTRLIDTSTVNGLYEGETVIDSTDGNLYIWELGVWTLVLESVSFDLSNQVHGLPSAFDGTAVDYTGANTQISVFSGSTDVTSSWTIVKSESAGITGTITTPGPHKLYTVTSLTADVATVEFTASKVGYADRIATFTAIRVRAGEGGVGTVYQVIPSVGALKYNLTDYTPSSVVFDSFVTTGASVPAAYAGRFKIYYSTNGIDYTLNYTSASDESTKSYTLPVANIKFVKAELFLAGGTTTLLDYENIPVIIDGAPGSQGLQGTFGNQGLQGNIGNQGLQGTLGTQGIQGTLGTTGAQGTQGGQGGQGRQGTLGTTGAQGAQGTFGPQGQQGIVGTIGAQGAQGVLGSQGQQGVTGPLGAQGNSGGQGPTGQQGITGPLGAQGIGGTPGPQGAQGNPGTTGPQGLQGTFGPTGQQGITGSVGGQGLQGGLGPVGQQGITGTTGAQGAQGNLGPAGQQGITGTTGAQGAQGTGGSQGRQGTIGIDGAQGTQGGQGGQGRQGTLGSTGAQGAQGTFGAQGQQGIVGATGTQGAAGTQGPTGQQGITGTPGAQGAQGTGGSQGRQGTTGPVGAQGTEGTPGPQGQQGLSGPNGPAGAQGTAGPSGPGGAVGAAGATGPTGASLYVYYSSSAITTLDTFPTPADWLSGATYAFNAIVYYSNAIYAMRNISGITGLTTNPFSDTANWLQVFANGVAIGETVTAPNFVIGKTYRITATNGTNFGNFGSSSSAPGTYFTCTAGTQNGAGTAQLIIHTKLTPTIYVGGESRFRCVDNNHYWYANATQVSGGAQAVKWTIFATETNSSNIGTEDFGNPILSIGETGAPGAAGPPGASGAQGPPGVQGNPGPPGAQGTAGTQGAQGRQGTGGATGSQGTTGTQGSQGGQGTGGATGAQGTAGTQGAQGRQGTLGTTGAQGTAGTQGAQGRQGTLGATGSQGITGTQGSQGGQGTGGATGSQGTTGTQGSQGGQGTGGATGSQGTAGTQGAQGRQGTGGATGSQGTTGTQGSQGGQGTGGATGSQGTAGTQGSQGGQGIGGATGSQGTAGTQGSQGGQGTGGATGSQGTAGTQGSQGGQGTGGATGSQGTAGTQGSQGGQGTGGATGSQGSVGVTGSQGGQGVSGPTGNPGPPGTPGPEGAQGGAGPNGGPGPPGANGPPGGVGPPGGTGGAGPPGPNGPPGGVGPPGGTGASGPPGPAGSAGNAVAFDVTGAYNNASGTASRSDYIRTYRGTNLVKQGDVYWNVTNGEVWQWQLADDSTGNDLNLTKLVDWIDADSVKVTSLSALTATIGLLRTASSGARTEIEDNVIRVYDSSNVLRVRMGIW